jgi:hypothetical protein
MLRFVLIAGAFVGLLSPGAAARAQGQPAVTGGRVAAEFAGGLVAMPVGFFGGGLATRWAARRFGADEERAGSIAMVGAYTGAVLLTAVPPTLIGASARHTTGSYLAALAGSLIGGLGSFALVRLNRQHGETDRPCHLVCTISFAGILILPSAGATTGFNLSRRYAGPPRRH